MSNFPLISIVIGFFNAERFLEEAITSVFAQTYEHWELLLVDDGSTDGSSAIAKHYVAQYPHKVSYLEHAGHRNLGSSAARNLGICHASGTYLALLDADDIWLPPKLETQVAILNQHPHVGMVFSSTYMWYGWTGKPEDKNRDRGRAFGVRPDTILDPPLLIPLFLREEVETPGTCGVLIRCSILMEVGLWDESFRGMFDDQVFFYKICLKFPVFVQGGTWDRYRQHADSMCHVAERAGLYAPLAPNATQLNFLKWLTTYLNQQGIKNLEIERALEKALWPYHYPHLYQLRKLFQRLKAKIERTLAQRIVSCKV
jgi:glycosyltransferase involved in cell wall biosynthesis